MFSFHQGLLICWLIIVLDAMSGQIILPMLPDVLRHFWPESDRLLPAQEDMAYGAILSIFNFAVLWGAPCVGAWSDRWGRHRLLMITLSLQALSALSMAGALSVRSFWVLLLSRVIQGLSTFGNVAIIQSMLIEWSRGDLKKRGLYFSWMGLGLTVGMAIGPLIGGYMVDRHPGSLAEPFLLLTVFSLILMFFFRKILLTDPIHSRRHVHQSFVIREAIQPVFWLLLAYFLFETGWSFYYIKMGIHLAEVHAYSAVQVGTWFSIFGFSLSVSLAAYPLWGSMRSNRQVEWGLLCIVVCIGFSQLGGGQEWIFWLTAMGMPLGVPMVYIAITNRLAVRSHPAHQGWVMGVSQAALALAWMVSGGLCRWLYHCDAGLPDVVALSLLLSVFMILIA